MHFPSGPPFHKVRGKRLERVRERVGINQGIRSTPTQFFERLLLSSLPEALTFIQ